MKLCRSYSFLTFLFQVPKIGGVLLGGLLDCRSAPGGNDTGSGFFLAVADLTRVKVCAAKLTGSPSHFAYLHHATQKRRVVVSRVNASEISGVDFFRAVVSILADFIAPHVHPVLTNPNFPCIAHHGLDSGPDGFGLLLNLFDQALELA